MTHETKQAYAILCATLLGTIAVHFLLLEYPHGWPFAAFVAFVALALVFVRSFSDRPVNAWVYVFLPPALLVALAHMLYANSVLRSFGWSLAAASLGLFAYWLFAPKTMMKQAMNFWPSDLFAETLLPVGHGSWLRRLSFHRDSKQVLIGLAIAIPVVIVFLGLFMSADALVSKVLGDAFRLDNPAWFLLKLILDVAFIVYFSHFLWTALTRSAHERHPSWPDRHVSDFTIAIATFLGVLNLLFLGFIAFQFVYFFGGQAVVEVHGLTYSSYAREGFFQLFTASVLVFALVFGIARQTRMRSLAVRLLSLGLIVQSWIVIASAVKRLSLYVDAYGLSVLRFWALAGLVAVALGLLGLAAALAARSRFETVVKAMAVVSLYVFAGLLLVNVEATVVRWNAARPPTESVAPDYLYPYQLSSDAMPAYAEWLASASDRGELPYRVVERALHVKHPERYDRFRTTQVQAAILKDLQEISIMAGKSLSSEQEMVAYYDGEIEMTVWKRFLAEKEASFLREDLQDPRAWTLSHARALEALERLR